MKITAKLTLGVGLVLSLSLVIGAFASRAMSVSAEHAAAVGGKDLAGIRKYLGFEGNVILSCLGTRTYGYTAQPADKEFGARYLATAQQSIEEIRDLARTTGSPELSAQAEDLQRQIDAFARLSERTIAITDAMSADKRALDALGGKIGAALDALNSSLTSSPGDSRVSTTEIIELNTKTQRLRVAAWHGVANRSHDDLGHAGTLGAELLATVARHRDAAGDNLRPLWTALHPLLSDYTATLARFAENWRQFDTSNSERFAVVEDLLHLIDRNADQTVSSMTERGDATAAELEVAVHRLWIGLGLAVLLGAAIAIVLTRSLTRPIRTCVGAMDRLAQGDLTVRVGLKRADELGDLSRSIDASISGLRDLVGNLGNSSGALVSSAQALKHTATGQAAAAEQTTTQAHTVATAGEQLSANAKAMSASATQITQSTGTVAAAMEEMSSSIQEVARNCAQESEIARKADEQARQTRDQMARLEDSARQIGKVVDLINRIAEQTNLLALNAAIEAASAGEAGRGFAVVANEVKELARQSAAATEDIRKQVDLIQQNAGSSMKSLDEVAKVIEQVAHIASSIAAAVEQQSATTSEIVGTINQVSSATSTLSHNVSQTADGAAEVARNISGVSQAASDVSQSASVTSTSASELDTLAAGLRRLVERFKTA
jgi:methyl-accepting chemotaxis protein